MQSKQKSLIESIVNTFVGLLVTLLFSPFIYWVCGVEISYIQMSYATVLFTILSILRNYFIRRFFNKQR
jgi:membrane protein implicated in regulation of membrane protease activity